MIDLDQSTKIDNIEAEEDDEILSIPAEDLTDLNEPDQREKLMCDFIIKQVIGEGTFATVRLAVNKQTGEKVAIKIMEKNKIVQKVDKIRIEREIKVLKNLMHPNIVHLYNVIQSDDKIYLIMEYVKGKELFDYIVMKKKLSENESCLFYQQIISGIEYLHKLKYVHRDIKPENLLINEETKELKIVDFGLSNIYTNPNKHLLKSACGSPSYAAPEMLNGEKYRAPPVDIWSSGIVLFAMICGYLPFEDENNEVLYEKICKGKFVIPNHVSESGRDLLNKILVTDPKKRFTIFQIKNHPWFSLYNNKGKLMLNEGLILSKYVIPIDEDVVSSMRNKYNITAEKIRISILLNKHDDISTIYYLLLHKKIRNKKKSVADLKGDLFKKYCDNKNNLLENYDKDLNKVLEERKNGYSYELQSSNSKVLISNLSDFPKKLNINKQNSSIKNNNKNSNKNDLNGINKRKRFFSPENKGNNINIIYSTRDTNNNGKKNDKKKIIKFKSKKDTFNPRISYNIKEKKELNKNMPNNLDKKEIKEKEKEKKIKNDNKEQKEEKEKEKNLETENKDNADENNENKTLIKHREKKVHYEKKVNKNKKYNKIFLNNKASIRGKNKNKDEIQTSINKLTNNDEIQKSRIKSARTPFSEKKTDNVKKVLEFNGLRQSVNSIIDSNQKPKSRHMHSKSNVLNESGYKFHSSDKKENLSKFGSYKSPKREKIPKLNLQPKINKSLYKDEIYRLSERKERITNYLNKTGGFRKINKDIFLSEDTKNKAKRKIKINIIYEKTEQKNNYDKQKLISSPLNNSSSQEKKQTKMKHFLSYSKKKKNNTIQSGEYTSRKISHNKMMLFKHKNPPILDTENNTNISFSKIDEDSILIAKKKLFLSYEPFDLNLAFIKPRKVIKEELISLFDKNKVKYRNISNTRYLIELKKEKVSLEIKFDKLSIINNEKNESGNNATISIIKLKRITGGYQGDIKSFEKIINKIN